MNNNSGKDGDFDDRIDWRSLSSEANSATKNHAKLTKWLEAHMLRRIKQ